MTSILADGRKNQSQGLKLSDLIVYTRLLLGLVSYFIRFQSSWPVLGPPEKLDGNF